MSASPEEGRYARVTRRMWDDAKFLALSPPQPNGQDLWQRLLTGPEGGIVPGLFRARLGGLAEALRWPFEDTKRCWEEIASQGMAEADWKAGLVWVPNAFFHNEPESTNVVRSWRVVLRELPECDLKQRAIETLKAYLEDKGEPWIHALLEALGEATRKPSSKVKRKASAKPPTKPSTKGELKGSPIQDQDQDQDQDQEQEQEQDAAAERATSEEQQQQRRPNEPSEPQKPGVVEAPTLDPSTGQPWKVRCPVPVPVPEDTLATLECSPGIPRPVARWFIEQWSVKQNAKVSDLRNTDTWCATAVAALCGEWRKDFRALKRGAEEAASAASDNPEARAKRKAEAEAEAVAKQREQLAKDAAARGVKVATNADAQATRDAFLRGGAQ